MWRSNIIILLLLFTVFQLNAQEAYVSQWTVRSEKKSDAQYLLHFKAQIPKEKFIYVDSLTRDADIYLRIQFPDLSVQSVGDIQIHTQSIQHTDPVFDQKNIQIVRDSISFSQLIRFKDIVPARLKGSISYAVGGADEFTPETYDFEVGFVGGVANQFQIKRVAIDIAHPLTQCGDEGTKGKSSWIIFLLGLLGGFVALLTPCVFPLIPLTVSFFTKKSSHRRDAILGAGLYGLFILVIYMALSIPFHLLDSINPEILNNISTNTWLNIIFFIIFLFFAVSFFGYFEITLPAKFATGADAKSSIGSITGIFFMALTLAIVSFSCTGPILGSLLAGALTKEGGAWQLTAGMSGFGLGLALPFALFALFPQWLQSLPRSGGWLNTVKVVLGFLELAMAVKFFSNADLVEQWGVLKREIFIAIWLLISLCIVLYLLGFIRFPHDDTKRSFGLVRVLFIGLFILISVYLAPGITNTSYAKLSYVSGFPPPVCYSLYDNPVNCRHEVEPLKDYQQALTLARKQQKPLLIDFTGWACVNCRKMEEQVWTDTDVRALLLKEFIVVSLYVDDRKLLSSDQQQTFKTYSGIQREILTVGDLWATFQSENFHAVSQPQYAMLGNDEKLLARTKGYTPDPTDFRNWLICGMKAFKKN
ncbi:MAG: protein-disulfide reductase DsbD family protein [Bacteroidota bacterium]